MRIYFAGSIRGGQKDATLYKRLIKYLKGFGEVLTEHIGEADQKSISEKELNDESIHNRDIDWLLSANVLVAEVTVPSLGVGYEIGRAACEGIPLICLYRKVPGRRLSAMIAGCPHVKMIYYNNIDEVTDKLSIALRNLPSLKNL